MGSDSRPHWWQRLHVITPIPLSSYRIKVMACNPTYCPGVVTITADTKKKAAGGQVFPSHRIRCRLTKKYTAQSLRQELHPNSMVTEDLKCNLRQLKLALLTLRLPSTNVTWLDVCFNNSRSYKVTISAECILVLCSPTDPKLSWCSNYLDYIYIYTHIHTNIHTYIQSGPRKSSPPSVLHCKSLCYIWYTSTWLDVRSCVLMQEATTFSSFYDGISFQHLATVISVFTLCYGPGLLFRGLLCMYICIYIYIYIYIRLDHFAPTSALFVRQPRKEKETRNIASAQNVCAKDHFVKTIQTTIAWNCHNTNSLTCL
jgi:hypothetical protein